MSIFSKIIEGSIPSYKIAENDLFYAFLDINPLVHGHVLVVPKQEVDKLYEASNEVLAALLLFAQPIAKAIEASFDCKRCGMSVIGLEVPHAHLHLVPMNTADDLNFTRDKLKPTADELQAAQEKILHNLK